MDGCSILWETKDVYKILIWKPNEMAIEMSCEDVKCIELAHDVPGAWWWWWWWWWYDEHSDSIKAENFCIS
jgi:hypothetical protein